MALWSVFYMNRPILLEAEHLSKIYRSPFGKERCRAVSDFSLTLYEGESLGLMGKSGAGKSTILRMLLGLLAPDGGTVRFEGRSIHDFGPKDKRDFHQKVQFIAQRPESFFDPKMTFQQSMAEAVHLLGMEAPTAGARDLMLRHLDLDQGLLQRYPHQISGGEIQRLAIYRALLARPKLIMFDEATSMLDVSTQAKIIQMLKTLQAEQALTYLFISHDQGLIEKICDRVIAVGGETD